ncbi:MAG: hypothetical protein ABI873_13625 [Marmoricola sp.]
MAWAAEAGSVGDVGGGGLPTPASAADAADLIRYRILDVAQQGVCLSFLADPANPSTRARAIYFESFGQVSYLDLDPETDQVQVAEDLVTVLTDLAPMLDSGLVRPMEFSSAEWGRLDIWWPQYHHLWSSHVPDVHAVQLITGAQIERAHDLSWWQVSEVAPDRWLVRAHDLSPWFAVPERVTWSSGSANLRYSPQMPPVDLLTQARQDFGDMLFTDDVIARNPPPVR